MIICGQEFAFSALNANDVERMETAQKHQQEATPPNRSATRRRTSPTPASCAASAR